MGGDEGAPNGQFLQLDAHVQPGLEHLVPLRLVQNVGEDGNVAMAHVVDLTGDEGRVGRGDGRDGGISCQEIAGTLDGGPLVVQRRGMPEHAHHLDIRLCRPPDASYAAADEGFEQRRERPAAVPFDERIGHRAETRDDVFPEARNVGVGTWVILAGLDLDTDQSDPGVGRPGIDDLRHSDLRLLTLERADRGDVDAVQAQHRCTKWYQPRAKHRRADERLREVDRFALLRGRRGISVTNRLSTSTTYGMVDDAMRFS